MRADKPLKRKGISGKSKAERPFPLFISQWGVRLNTVLTHVYESLVPDVQGYPDRCAQLWWVVWRRTGSKTWNTPTQYRWTVFAANGRIVCASSEGYRNKAKCIENAVLFGAPMRPRAPDGVRRQAGDGSIRTWDWLPGARNVALKYHDFPE